MMNEKSKRKKSLEIFLGTGEDSLKEKILTSSDIRQLQRFLRNTQEPELKELIKIRIIEVLEKEIDMDKLYSYWASAYLESESLEFIESRMIEVLDFPLNKIPKWFWEYVENNGRFPSFLENSLKKKAQEVYDSF